MNKKYIIILILCINFFLTNNTYANQFYSNIMGPIIHNNKIIVFIDGKYSKFTYNDLKKIYEKHFNNEIIIYANSNGGYAEDVFKIMDLIKNHKNTIFLVEKNDRCISMCALTAIFSKRIEGEIYFHGISINGELSEQYNNKLKKYLIKNNISKNFSEKITSTLNLTKVLCRGKDCKFL